MLDSDLAKEKAAQETVVAPAFDNKLMTRDSVNMVLMLSLVLGILALIVSILIQKHDSKYGIDKTYLPRPGQKDERDEKSK